MKTAKALGSPTSFQHNAMQTEIAKIAQMLDDPLCILVMLPRLHLVCISISLDLDHAENNLYSYRLCMIILWMHIYKNAP